MTEMVAIKNSFGGVVHGIPVDREMPRPHKAVLAFIEDAGVAIHAYPVVAWNSGTDKDPQWWTGVPGDYVNLAAKRWSVTHWRPLATEAT